VAGVPVGVASGVSDGAVQVAQGAQGPTSVAALRLAADPGRGVDLVLQLAPSSSVVPFTVAASPTTTAWQHANGGALADAPRWDCALGATSSAYDPVARTLSFSFPGSFERGGAIDVALLPVDGESPFVATTEVPGDGAATPAKQAPAGAATTSSTVAPSPPPSRAAATKATSPTPPATAGSATSPSPAPEAAPGAPLPTVTAPGEQAAPALPSALPKADQLVPAATTHRGGGTAGRVLGLLLLVGVVLAALAAALGLRAPGVAAVEGDGARGVGRFRAARDVPPTSV
jgi:hypothetical protein